MIALGIIVERAVLQPLINQPPITLFIATLGLSYIIEGVAQLLWGTQVHGLDIGISNIPFDVDGCVFISWFDLFAAAVAGSLVALFTLFLRAPAVGTMLSNRSRSNPLARIDDAAERAWSAERIANILARETIVVTPEAKSPMVGPDLACVAPPAERTPTGLSVLLQSQMLKHALQPYCLGGPYGRLLRASRLHAMVLSG
jgi:hypothetical protein